MFGWFKKKVVEEKIPEKSNAPTYQERYDKFCEENSEKIKKLRERKNKFQIGDCVKSIYQNSPEMTVFSSSNFYFDVRWENHTNGFYNFYLQEYVPKVVVKYFKDGELVTLQFYENELILASRKDS